MDNTKIVELLRKRNSQIHEELDRLKKLTLKNDGDSDDKKVSDLIKELEDIREEWMKVLEELNQDCKEYRELIEDLRNIRETFVKI